MASDRTLKALAAALTLGTSVAAAALAQASYVRWRAYRCTPQPTGRFELYAIGDSTPAGIVYGRKVSFPILAIKAFDGEIAGRPISLINLAHAGDTIRPQEHALEEALRCRNTANPGAVMIYSGHNDRSPRKWTSLIELFEEQVLFQSTLARDAIFHIDWLLSKKFGPRPFAQYHLRRAVELSQASGLVPILALPVSNISDIDTGLSMDPELPAKAELNALLDQGLALEKKGRWREAVDFYDSLGRSRPALRSYAAFSAGKCRQRLGDDLGARRAFWEAVDLNTRDTFGRASSQQHDFMRRLAKERGIAVVDAVDVFRRASPHGLIGENLFIDGHHPNAEGTALLADAFAAALAQRFGVAVKRRFAGSLTVPPRMRINALLYGGRWLLSSSMGHMRPALRLGLAERRFRAVLALDPDDYSAWLGLSLIEAARRHGDLTAVLKPPIPWYGSRFALTEKEQTEVLERLTRMGVPKELLSQISRTYSPAQAAR